MGVVWEARDSRLGRGVALKFLPASVADDPESRARFEREARAASALMHRNMCVLYDIGERQGRPYLVMELLAGQTLAERLAERPLEETDLVRLARHLAAALRAAHDQGILHRGHAARHGEVHVARAGAGPRPRRPQRPVLARCRAVRGGNRCGTVRAVIGGGAAERRDQLGAGGATNRRAGAPGRPGRGDRAASAQEAGGALRHGGTSGRGAGAPANAGGGRRDSLADYPWRCGHHRRSRHPVDRRAAVRQLERRPGQRVLQRRAGRGADHQPESPVGAPGRGSQLLLPVQGAGARCLCCGPQARRRRGARRQCAACRRARACDRAVGRRRIGLSEMVGALRRHARGHLPDPGRHRQRHRQRPTGAARLLGAAGGDAQSHRQPRGL